MQTLLEEAPVSTQRKKSLRLPFLDWTRGLAATIMLQGHVFHSFTRPDQRDSGPYVLSQFLGGIAPAIFLFLTGVTLAFMMHGMERKGATAGQRVMGALKRAAYLGALAFAFRIQMYLSGYPQSPVNEIFKVDVLNCMALTIITLAGLAVLKTSERAQGAILMGLGIAAAAPVVSMIPQDALPKIVRMYLVPDPNYFAYFPWAAFLTFGVAAGSILKLVKEDGMNRLMQWSAILGFGLVMSAQYFSNLPYSLYPSSDFWLNSPGLTLIKVGVILVILAVTFLWTTYGAGQGWSWIRQLGTESLLVYWVHIELVYGRWFGFWKENLTTGQCAVAAASLILVMIGLAYLKSNWKSLPQLRLDAVLTPEPRRVSGD